MSRIAAAGLVTIATVAGSLAAVCAQTPRAAEDTVLIDQIGERFTLHGLRGRPAVVTFVATRCNDSCPFSNTVFEQLARHRTDAALVTITLDPDYDTPFIMGRFAQTLGAKTPHWRVASGQPHDVDVILAAFGVERDHRGDSRHAAPEAHSTFIYLLDRNSRISKILLLSTHTQNDIIASLKRL
jgi:cytochrome oxidase Cu insertion factor (SCO1/SenC/PrrC family)